jgi:glucosamine-6-phosphate deaminase
VPADVRVLASPAAIGETLAAEIAARHDAADGRFLLGCAGGRSLRTTYAALGAMQRPFARLVVVMMDEYLEAPAHAHFSCTRFAHEEIAEPLGVPADRVWLPDPADPPSYDERIADAGGIEIFLLASGATDGHVAFLPPGSPRDGRTSVVAIAETTRRDNLVTFPRFEALAEVPTHGVSVGLGTIAAAKSLRLVLHGADKRAAAKRVQELARFDDRWPASIVHDHPDALVYLDAEAAE